MKDKSTLEEYLSVFTSKSFIKSAIYDETNQNLFLNYYNSYEEYKNSDVNFIHPEERYEYYFGTGSKIEKIIALESPRLLREFPFLKSISVSLTFKGELYSATIYRDKLNELIGFNIEDTSVEDGTWKDKFVDVYGYGKKNEKRKELFEQFLDQQVRFS